MADDILEILQAAGLDDYYQVVKNHKGEVSALLPSRDSFTVSPLPKFQDEAERRVGPYYDKDLELLRRDFEQERKFAAENKDVELSRIEENQGFYAKIQDKNFARSLRQAQSGFAGRGTFTSGIRNRAISESQEDMELEEEEKQRGFARDREDRLRQFMQFIPRSELQQERGELGISREKNAALLTAQSQLQAEERAAKASKIDYTDALIKAYMDQRVSA